jgi:hypothetical protein
MTEKNYKDAEIDELDGFLKSEFNHDIYEQLVGDEYEDFKGLFEPLEFFKSLFTSVRL